MHAKSNTVLKGIDPNLGEKLNTMETGLKGGEQYVLSLVGKNSCSKCLHLLIMRFDGSVSEN